MKTQKYISILLTAILLTVTACSTQMEDTPDTGYPDPTEENQDTKEEINSDTAYPAPAEENQVTNEEISSDTGSDPTVDSDIIGVTWLWERYDDTAGLNNIVVDDPALYTLLLNPDGTYQVKADCNQASGRYTLEGSSIKLEPGPTTLAECEPGSLYNTFLMNLGNTATFVTDNDRLYMNLWADAGNMVFIPTEQ